MLFRSPCIGRQILNHCATREAQGRIVFDINFPLRTSFAASHRFWIIVFLLSFVSRYVLISSLISSVISCLFSNVLFSLHVFVFCTFFRVTDFNLIALWSEKMLDTISIFLNFPKLDLWPKM